MTITAEFANKTNEIIITPEIANKANKMIDIMISDIKKRAETALENIEGREKVLTTLHMISEAKSVIEKKTPEIVKEKYTLNLSNKKDLTAYLTVIANNVNYCSNREYISTEDAFLLSRTILALGWQVQPGIEEKRTYGQLERGFATPMENIQMDPDTFSYI